MRCKTSFIWRRCTNGSPSGWNVCTVVNEECVVLGLLETEAIEAAPETPVARVMQRGPSTFRPSISVQELDDYLRAHGMDRALITTLDGRLVGLFTRADAERILASAPDGSG